MDVEVAQKTMVELEREAHKLSEQQNMKQALIVASNTKMLDSITEAIAKVNRFVLRLSLSCACVGVGVDVCGFVFRLVGQQSSAVPMQITRLTDGKDDSGLV